MGCEGRREDDGLGRLWLLMVAAAAASSGGGWSRLAVSSSGDGLGRGLGCVRGWRDERGIDDLPGVDDCNSCCIKKKIARWTSTPST